MRHPIDKNLHVMAVATAVSRKFATMKLKSSSQYVVYNIIMLCIYNVLCIYVRNIITPYLYNREFVCRGYVSVAS